MFLRAAFPCSKCVEYAVTDVVKVRLRDKVASLMMHFQQRLKIVCMPNTYTNLGLDPLLANDDISLINFVLNLHHFAGYKISVVGCS